MSQVMKLANGSVETILKRSTGLKTQDTVSNKKLGNSFEEEFAELLYEHGFWVHLLQQNAAGQPADIIATKNKTPLLIDCKECTNNRFPLSRIEDNQHSAMDLWRDRGNGEPWFALKVQGVDTDRDYIFMIPHLSMKAISITQSSLNLDDIIEYGTEFGKWVKKCK